MAKITGIHADGDAILNTVIFQVRFPRIIAAILIGGGLSISGASFQGIFKNPLVSPHILGVASGAGFGATLAILFSKNSLSIQFFAFLFGVLSVFLAYIISSIYKTTSTLVLVLAGIIVGTFFSALISLVKYIADPYEKLPAIVFWLMGSLSAISDKDVIMIFFPMVIGMGVILIIRWRINILSMGDEEAKSLGINTKRLRFIIIMAATFITASAVSVSGIIGWIGLVIPHIGRMFVGPDYKKLLPLTFFIGASYLLIVDDFARTLTTAEIPLGILTAIIGAPLFAYLLKEGKTGWEGK